MPTPSRRAILFLVLLALALAVPLLQSTYYTRFATQIAMYGMAAVSVDLLLGYAGLVTFGQAAFFGVGAYAAGMITAAGIHEGLIVWPLADPRHRRLCACHRRSGAARPRGSSSSW